MDTQKEKFQLKSCGNNEPSKVHVLPQPTTLSKKYIQNKKWVLRWLKNPVNKIKNLSYKKKWRDANKEKIRAYNHNRKKYRNIQQKKYNEKYRKTKNYIKYIKNYYQRPERKIANRLHSFKRRALKNMIDHTDVNFKKISLKTNNTCLYCGEDLNKVPSNKKDIDHYYPLSLLYECKDLIQHIRFSEIIGSEKNLWLSCESCNESKYNKLPLNWIWEKGEEK